MAILFRLRRLIPKGDSAAAVPMSRDEFAKWKRYSMCFDAVLIALVIAMLWLDVSIWIKRLAALVLIISIPGEWLWDSYESYLDRFTRASSSTK